MIPADPVVVVSSEVHAMNDSLINRLVLSASAGLILGLQGCGGSAPAPAAPSQATPDEPAEGKHSCSAAAEKNGCGGMDSSKPDTKPADPTSAADKK
jgi:hypothetical protein